MPHNRDWNLRISDIPWTVIKDFRNHLAHEYFGVVESIVWDTIVNDLPELKKALLKIT